MQPRPVGSLVTLSPYDLGSEIDPPSPGDYIRSNGGTFYEVVECHAGRPAATTHYRVKAIKLGRIRSDELQPGRRVYSLEWYPRKSTRPVGYPVR